RWFDARSRAPEDASLKLSGRMGDIREVLSSRILRTHVAVGMGLAVCGQVGLWGIGYWTPELIRGAQAEMRMARSNETNADNAALADDRLVARGAALQDAAGMCGIYAFALATARVGRRWAFAATYLLAFVATVFTFSSLRTPADV